MLDKLIECKNGLDKQGVIFYYNGPFSQRLIEGICDVVSKKLTLDMVSTSIIAKVFSMVVEHSHNIMFYSQETVKSRFPADKGADLKAGTLMIALEDEKFAVYGGNKIANDKVPALKTRLERVQAMDKDELKAFYREQRKRAPDGDSKGGGIGIIEMAKKGSKPFEFQFKEVDNDSSLYLIKTYV